MTVDSDSARFSRSLRSAILWPVGVIFVTAFLLLLLTFQLFEVVKWSDHSYQVLEQTRQSEKLILGLQNNVRGYVLTRDPSFVAGFTQQRAEISANLEALKNFVSDNSSQLAQAKDLITAKDNWYEHSLGTVTQLSKGSSPATEWTLEGKRLMDDLMDKFDKFDSIERALQKERLANTAHMKQILVFSGGILALLLTLVVGQIVKRHFMRLDETYRTALKTIEQRQAELEEQKEWFRVTLGSIGDGVIVTDLEGGVVFMNEEAERLTGWKTVEAMKKPLTEIFNIVNEDTRRVVENPVGRVFREKKVVGLANHTMLISRQGIECPIEDSAAPICDAKQNMLGVVLVFHNATEIRHAQNKLRSYSQDLEKKVSERTLTLQETVTEMEAFSYTISHDLRSPLRAMQGFAEAVLEDYGDKIGDDGRNYLNRIKNAATRLDRLIQDLLAYTRLTRTSAPLIPIDLDKSIRDIVEHYPNLHPPAANIEITGTLPLIMGREAALTQVISNLLGNAAKFVPSGSIPQIKVRGEDRGERVRVWIEDNGIGIAQRDFERIFQMFTQINESVLYGGTGVGLAIVKKAIETMHGSVGLESEEGKGSKFWVELIKAT